MLELTENLGLALNEYGVVVSRHRCLVCLDEFTVVPPYTKSKDWGGCLSEGCPTYSEPRDVDRLFDDGEDWKIRRSEA